MSYTDKVAFVRILNSTQVQGKELWVIASVVRLLNVLRVWMYEVDLKLIRMEQTNFLRQEDLKTFGDSSEHILKMLRQAYVVLQAKELKPELAFLEEELFKFETLYIHSNLYLVINEERIEFDLTRFEFLRHSLHGVLHDLSHPISGLKNLVTLIIQGDQEQKSTFFKDVEEVMVQSKSQIDRGFELIKGSFNIEYLKADRLESIIKETFESILKHDIIKFEIKNTLAPDVGVSYSTVWFRGLLSNIIDNAKKSFWIKGERLGHGDFERTIKIILRSGKIDDTDEAALEFGISDTGIGFSQDILSHGFEEGKSEWTDDNLVGQGVGMAAHVEYIKQLGGEVVLHNLNQNGHVDGAELVVRLKRE